MCIYIYTHTHSEIGLSGVHHRSQEIPWSQTEDPTSDASLQPSTPQPQCLDQGSPACVMVPHGVSDFPRLQSPILNMGVVSYTSNTPQNHARCFSKIGGVLCCSPHKKDHSISCRMLGSEPPIYGNPRSSDIICRIWPVIWGYLQSIVGYCRAGCSGLLFWAAGQALAGGSLRISKVYSSISSTLSRLHMRLAVS